MTFNPYEVLGVGRTARRATVTKAFRKLARKHHPDTGGAREDYERIQKAFDILDDPAKRARFDKTGDTDTKPQNDLSEIAQVVIPCYQECLKNLIEHGHNPEQQDLPTLMVNRLKSKIAEIENSLKQPKLLKDKFSKLLARWTVTDQPNVLEAATAQMIEGCDSTINAGMEHIGQLKRAHEFLKHFQFQTDKAEVKQMLNGFGTTNEFTKIKFNFGVP